MLPLMLLTAYTFFVFLSSDDWFSWMLNSLCESLSCMFTWRMEILAVRGASSFISRGFIIREMSFLKSE